MKKEYIYCLMTILAVIIGIIFAICGVLLQTNPLFSRSALLILSIVLILVGIASFAVNYKKYHIVTNLCQHKSPIIAHWTYKPNSSKIINNLIKEQKSNSSATATLFLILSIIFCIVFAYSGGTTVLYTGYILAVLCVCIYIISLRFISTYYEQLLNKETEVIFGEDCFYFLNELYECQRGYHFLEKVTVFKGDENHLIFAYGLYDVDEPPAYIVTIPIPNSKLHTAEHIKSYYMDLIKPE